MRLGVRFGRRKIRWHHFWVAHLKLTAFIATLYLIAYGTFALLVGLHVLLQ